MTYKKCLGCGRWGILHARNLCNACYTAARRAGVLYQYPTTTLVYVEPPIRRRCRCAFPALTVDGVCALCGEIHFSDERVAELREMIERGEIHLRVPIEEESCDASSASAALPASQGRSASATRSPQPDRSPTSPSVTAGAR